MELFGLLAPEGDPDQVFKVDPPIDVCINLEAALESTLIAIGNPFHLEVLTFT